MRNWRTPATAALLLTATLVLASIGGCPVQPTEAADENPTPIDAGQSPDQGPTDSARPTDLATDAGGDTATPDAGGATDTGGGTLTGGGTTGGTQPPPAPLGIAGTYQATLQAESMLELVGYIARHEQRSVPTSIEFDTTPKPVSLLILGYGYTPDLVTTVGAPGQTEVLHAETTGTDVKFAVTLTVAVRELVVSDATARIVLDLDYDGTSLGGGNTLTLTGTGTQTIDAALTADGLSYTATVDYSVTLALASASLSFPTTEHITSQGTLLRQ